MLLYQVVNSVTSFQVVNSVMSYQMVNSQCCFKAAYLLHLLDQEFFVDVGPADLISEVEIRVHQNLSQYYKIYNISGS